MPGLTGTIVIGGGSGFVGTHLSQLLQCKGYTVKIISRMPGPQRLSWHEISKNGLPAGTKAVVNLAGQNVMDMKQRWSSGFKQNIWNSRINTTKTLVQAIHQAECKPQCFIVMTGVGIYEPSNTKQYCEDKPSPKYDFLSELCHEWEHEASLAKDVCRSVIIRSGVVLGRSGGMIKQLYLPFFFGVGGPVGSGDQYLPWIHIDDICRLILFSIETANVEGVLNGVAPQQITNKEFSQAFAKALWRPAFIPVPESILNILLSEERAKMLTTGQFVIPKKTLATGFEYMYPNIEAACQEMILKK